MSGVKVTYMTNAVPSRHIVVVTTGGTIACTADEQGALVPTKTGDDLIEAITPQLEGSVISLSWHPLTQLDSSSLTMKDLDLIVGCIREVFEDESVDGIVVTHGTDSMEESALAVDTLIDDPRPVIFTGAQHPFDDPDTDGPQNLFEAVMTAGEPSARGIGTLIVFGHAVIPARGALKFHTSDELAFGTNAPEEPERADPVPPVTLADTRVDVLYAYPGAPRDLIDNALASGSQGIVVEAMGNGNVGTEFAEGLGDVLEKGIPVVISTRVPRGDVSGTYGGVGGGKTLLDKGALGSKYFRAGQSRILLAIAIASGRHPATLF